MFLLLTGASGAGKSLAGDPVGAGEVIAAPSADKLDAIAVCLLDVSADVQAARLAQRGDDPRLIADHQVADDILTWSRRAFRGQAPEIRVVEPQGQGR